MEATVSLHLYKKLERRMKKYERALKQIAIDYLPGDPAIDAYNALPLRVKNKLHPEEKKELEEIKNRKPAFHRKPKRKERRHLNAKLCSGNKRIG